MNTESVALTNALEGNEEFVAFLHEDARKMKIPAIFQHKVKLAELWEDDMRYFVNRFARKTGRTVVIQNVPEFLRQAAESYEG